jgi:hypothetical protein
MKRDVTIQFRGVELNVSGDYYKGTFGDRETPPESPEFEITRIELLDSSTDLSEMFYNLDAIDDIVEECLEVIENE